MVDSADKLRNAVAKNELEIMLNHVNIKSRAVPILFFANKRDLPHSLTDVEVCWELELDQITDRDWHIESSNALTGEGVEEGL